VAVDSRGAVRVAVRVRSGHRESDCELRIQGEEERSCSCVLTLYPVLGREKLSEVFGKEGAEELIAELQQGAIPGTDRMVTASQARIEISDTANSPCVRNWMKVFELASKARGCPKHRVATARAQRVMSRKEADALYEHDYKRRYTNKVAPTAVQNWRSVKRRLTAKSLTPVLTSIELFPANIFEERVICAPKVVTEGKAKAHTLQNRNTRALSRVMLEVFPDEDYKSDAIGWMRVNHGGCGAEYARRRAAAAAAQAAAPAAGGPPA